MSNPFVHWSFLGISYSSSMVRLENHVLDKKVSSPYPIIKFLSQEKPIFCFLHAFTFFMPLKSWCQFYANEESFSFIKSLVTLGKKIVDWKLRAVLRRSAQWKLNRNKRRKGIAENESNNVCPSPMVTNTAHHSSSSSTRDENKPLNRERERKINKRRSEETKLSFYCCFWKILWRCFYRVLDLNLPREFRFDKNLKTSTTNRPPVVTNESVFNKKIFSTSMVVCDRSRKKRGQKN